MKSHLSILSLSCWAAGVLLRSYSLGVQSWYWCSSRSSDVFSPGDWLVSGIWTFCPQGLLELWGAVRLPAHAGWSELFSQAAAVFFSCSCVCSAPPLARWGNSVLNAALCPGDRLWDPPPALLWEVSLLLIPSFSLYACPNLCWVLVAPLGGWLVSLLLLSAFAALWSVTDSSALRAQFLVTPQAVQQWEINSLPLPHFPGWIQCSSPPLQCWC
jgi:hypothetical protein